jgi:hypothetical protein
MKRRSTYEWEATNPVRKPEALHMCGVLQAVNDSIMYIAVYEPCTLSTPIPYVWYGEGGVQYSCAAGHVDIHTMCIHH